MGCTTGKPQNNNNNNNQMNKKRNFYSQNTLASHYVNSKSATMDMNLKGEDHHHGTEYFESADLCLEVVRAIKQRKREQYQEQDFALQSKLSIN